MSLTRRGTADSRTPATPTTQASARRSLDELAASLSLRHLKAARCVADFGSVTRAAEELSRTQSAITKALNELESQLGARLFDRSSRGMLTTAQGEVFIARIREAEAQFALPERVHAASVRGLERRRNPVFGMELSRRRLEAFLAVQETRDIPMAASRLGISRTAVCSSVRHLEELLELRLLEHGGPRLSTTAFGDLLAGQFKLAFALIRHGLDDIASCNGATQGTIAIGTLPYSRTLLTPRTIHGVLLQHPGLHITTREGPYALLELALRTGELDLIIGAIRGLEPESTLRTEALFEDQLAVIARAGHPLAGRKRVALETLLDYGWILPVADTPARQLFDHYLERHGAAPPRQIVETSSLSLIRGLLLDSDRLALLSRHQAQLDERAGLLLSLPIELEGTYRPIGITTRALTTPSPAARVFIAELRQMAAALQLDPGAAPGSPPGG